MSLREITLILLFQSLYNSKSAAYCSFCFSVKFGKYFNILSISSGLEVKGYRLVPDGALTCNLLPLIFQSTKIHFFHHFANYIAKNILFLTFFNPFYPLNLSIFYFFLFYKSIFLHILTDSLCILTFSNNFITISKSIFFV